MIRPQKKLSKQIKKHISKSIKKKPEYDGDVSQTVSTGSTLLDLAISGGRIHGGGIPGGILVEIFGLSGTGKTVLLCEIAGAVQRQNGKIMFHDPEGRLNKQFARMFDLDTDSMEYSRPDTVPQVFEKVRSWDPGNNKIHGIIADSLAALSTGMEMGEKGDKTGMRRAKEFSEECRKTCRVLANNNYLMVCSNQVRVNIDGGQFTPKYITPGGEAIGFYSSLRLRTFFQEKSKIKKIETISNKEVRRVIGINIIVEVFKSSVWKPYRSAPVTILFDYGIDDIRQNLQFIKDHTKNNIYTVLGRNLDKSLESSIIIIEKEGLEEKLKFETIELWNEVEKKFDSNRKTKIR